MKTIKHYTIKFESQEFQNYGKRYHPCQYAIYNRKAYPLRCGTSDMVSLFAEGPFYYALSVNYRMGYAGLQRFEKSEGFPLRYLVKPKDSTFKDWESLHDSDHNSIFIQNESDLPEGFFDKSDMSQVKALADILCQF
jgi:hypothetical protein